jgi:hypothetical protein
MTPSPNAPYPFGSFVWPYIVDHNGDHHDLVVVSEAGFMNPCELPWGGGPATVYLLTLQEEWSLSNLHMMKAATAERLELHLLVRVTIVAAMYLAAAAADIAIGHEYQSLCLQGDLGFDAESDWIGSAAACFCR